MKCLVIVFFLLMPVHVISGTVIGARSGSCLEVFRQFQEVSHKLDDFEMSFIQIEKNELLKKKKKSEGRIYALRGGKIFWIATSPSIWKLFSNGTTIWFYDGTSDTLSQESWGHLGNEQKVALLFLRGQEDLESYFDVKCHQNHYFSSLLPQKKMSVEKMDISIDRKTFFLKKIVFYLPLGRKTELIFSNMKINQGLLARHQKTPIDPGIDSNFDLFRKSK